MTDFQQAYERAQHLGRRLLVHFPGKHSFDQMEPDVFHAPAVEQLLGQFVAVRVDVEKAVHLKTRYKIKVLPTVLIVGLNGDVLFRSVGAKTAEAYVKMLRNVDGVAIENFSPRQSDPDVAESDRPGKSSNPRKEVLDAEFAVNAARAKVDEEEKICRIDRTDFLRTLEASKTGSVPSKRMREADKNVEINDARLKKAKLDLEHAEAQVKLARENLEAQRKVLELDLENAKLRMAHLANRESRARRLIENKAMSQLEYDETKLALEQAKLEIARIQEQLDLYSKPIRGVGVTTPDDQKPEEPAPAEKNEKSDTGGTREKLR
jgi:hypothetical protein